MVAGPTPYPDVNKVLNLLLARASAILGPQMVGMYLWLKEKLGDIGQAFLKPSLKH